MRRWPIDISRGFAFALALALPGFAEEIRPPRELCETLNAEGSYAAALEHCRQAESLQRPSTEALTGERDGGALGESLTSLGLALEMTGDRRGAASRYLEALERHRRLGLEDREALVLSNLAALAIGAGDYRAALDWLEQEEAVARRALAKGGASWAEPELSYVRINRSVALEQLGAYPEALAELQPLAKRERARSEAIPADPEEAALFVNLAVLYRNLGDPRQALRLLDRAAAGYAREGDQAALANVHLNRALVHQLNLRQPDSASSELAKARALALASGDRGELVRILTALGELRLGESKLAEAREAFTEAATTAVAVGAAAGRWNAEAGLARVARASGDDDAAFAHFERAISEIERVGSELESARLASDLLADQRAVYAAAVDLVAERALEAPAESRERAAVAALALAERARARELLAALNSEASEPLSEAAIFEATRELGPTLAYFFGEKRLWRWESKDGHWSVTAAADAAAVGAQITRVYSRLSRGEPADSADLSTLASALLPPGATYGPELRVVPDGRLFFLPFEILESRADGPPLVASTAVSYLPSLSVFAHLSAPPPSPRWKIAALADPQLPRSVDREEARSFAGLLAHRARLPPLPGAAREARAAAALLGEPAAVDVGAAASEVRLRARAGEGSRVLHIAAHTVIDDALAGGVALFLAAEGPEPPRDGLLTPDEIVRLPLSTDLAVLSACRTAIAEETMPGRGDSGRGLASLSGAFLGAGASGVVASLWEVGDAATAALMEQFYARLARGDRPAEALRRAKWTMARSTDWGAAAAWSGFVLLGSPGPVRGDESTGAPLLFGGAGLLALAAAAYLWRASRRRV